MAQAIGAVVGGLMSMMDLGGTLFPIREDEYSKINIAVALDSEHGGTVNAGGDVPDILLLDSFGGYVGEQEGEGKIETGAVKEIKVKHEGKGKTQAPYTLFTARNDAICIAYATITWPDENKYFWDGSFGHACNGSWFFSNIYVQGSNYSPHCTWIDANGDHDEKGFQIRWPTYQGKFLENKVSDVICDTVDFRIYYDKPEYVSVQVNPSEGSMTVEDVNKDGERINRRNELTTQQKIEQREGDDSKREKEKEEELPLKETEVEYGQMNVQPEEQLPPMMEPQQQSVPTTGSHLVIDDSTNSAQILCESATSRGPDYVNVQSGEYCEMNGGEKKLFPICDFGNVTPSGTASSAGFPIGNPGVVDDAGNINPGNIPIQNGASQVPSGVDSANFPVAGSSYSGASNIVNSGTMVNQRRNTGGESYQCFDMQTLTLRGINENPNVAKRAPSKYKVTTDWREGKNVKRYL